MSHRTLHVRSASAVHYYVIIMIIIINECQCGANRLPRRLQGRLLYYVPCYLIGVNRRYIADWCLSKAYRFKRVQNEAGTGTTNNTHLTSNLIFISLERRNVSFKQYFIVTTLVPSLLFDRIGYSLAYVVTHMYTHITHLLENIRRSYSL